jgi:hypothetical protein
MNGLIAFFDILGYQSFLENNSASDTAASDAALNVLKLITEIPLGVKKLMADFASDLPDKSNEAKEIANLIKHLIFSDTIVLSIEYPLGASSSWKKAALAYITTFSGILFNRMFDKGLPMRGVIEEGEFLIKDTCFAGKAIVNAYKLCDSLDFAGLVYSSSLGDSLPRILNFQKTHPSMIPYLSPKNGLKEEKLIQINWILASLDELKKKEILSDIETYVLRAFWAHNKDCPLSVDVKVQNTVKLCRRLAIALQSLPKED